MTVFISAGHNPSQVGACNGSWCEYPNACEWVDLVTSALTTSGISVVKVPTGSLTEKVAFINSKYKRGDIAIEIHFNSNVNAKGSESLYYHASVKGRSLATIIQKHISPIFAPDRGAKEGWFRMDKPGVLDYVGDVDGDEKPDYFLAKCAPVAVIVEPEFVYNKTKLDANKHNACIAISKAIIEYLNTSK